MKNTIKMSLVAAVAVAGLTTTSSASTLAEAFAASTVKGEIKSNYFTKKKATGVNPKSSIFGNGANLSLKTGSYNGLTAGITFQTASVKKINDKTGAYNGTMDVSGATMSESYLAYTLANTTAKIGRQYISTPLLAGSGSRLFKQSFEATALVNTDIPNTTILAVHATKFQERTDGEGGSPEFTKSRVNNGASTIYAKNTSIPNLTVEAQYVNVKALADSTKKDKKIAYLAADYKLLDAVKFSAQAYNSDNGSTTKSKARMYGVKVAGNIDGASLSAAYTTNGTNVDVTPGIGSGADSSLAGSPIVGGIYSANTKAYKLAAGYKIMDLGVAASYTNWKQNTLGTSSETNLTVSYAINKELSAKVMHSAFKNRSDDSASRVYLSYKF